MANYDSIKSYNLEAECACICAMIKEPRAYSEGLSRLEANDFFDKKNAAAFKILVSLYNKKSEVNEVTIFQEANVLGFSNLVDKDYLRDIQEFSYASSTFNGLVKIITENSITRKLFAEFNTLANNFTSNQYDSLNDFLSVAKQNLNTVLDSRDVSGFLSPEAIVNDLSIKLEHAHKTYSDRDYTGLTTGFKGIDKLTLGFQPGNLIILAARPGVGKTSLALNIAQHVSDSKLGSVAFFSQEMQSIELFNRILSFKSRIPAKDLSRGKFDSMDRTRMSSALDSIKEGKIYVDETPGIEWLDLVAKAKQFKTDHADLSLIVIDHIGLIKNKAMESKSNVSRTQVVGYISKNLKILAKELNIPILVLCQLSRKVDDNPGRRPMLSNLRESGDIEQDADLVLGMSVLDPNSALAKKVNGGYSFSKNNYAGNKKTPDATDEDKLAAENEAGFNKEYNKILGDKKDIDGDYGLMLIETLKNRNGPKLKVPLEWNGKLTCFYDMDEEASNNILGYVNDLN